MRMGLFLLMGFLVPLKCLGMEFLHKDTVLMTDIDGITEGRLGWAAAVSHGDVFMGAPRVFVEPTTSHGATYQYRINEQRQLDFVRELDPQAAKPTRYGVTIVAQGELTAVGYSSIDGIEIYKLESGNWVLVKLLLPPVIDNVTIRNFGEFFDLEGDFLAVANWSANAGGVGNAGVVMIFGRNVGGADNWGLVTHFLDPDPAPPPDARFATSVAISSDLMAVADDVTERVLLYLHSDNTWSYLKELQKLGAEADDGFAASVEAEGDFVAVGATNGNDAELPSNAGSVHIFSRDEGGNNNFGQMPEITPSEPLFIDEFGKFMRLRQGLLVVGAPGAKHVYVFSRLSGNWTEEQQILPPEGLDYFNPEFGSSVDYHHGSIVVGSESWPDIESVRHGAVFLYEDPGIVLCGHLDSVFCDGFESDSLQN